MLLPAGCGCTQMSKRVRLCSIRSCSRAAHLEGGKVLGGVVHHLDLERAKLGGANLGQVDVGDVGHLRGAGGGGATSLKGGAQGWGPAWEEAKRALGALCAASPHTGAAGTPPAWDLGWEARGPPLALGPTLSSEMDCVKP